MIYPDDYKCLVCKKRYYGCKYKKTFGMLSCFDFKRRPVSEKKVANLALHRCLTGHCPVVLALRVLQ